ncbi:heat shock protein 90 [Bacillus subtilis]|nr:heat shock protein 90 [Bacillus subtilis]
MKNILSDKVKNVRISKRLKSHPVCLAADGEVTIEMEKILNAMPDSQNVKAEKVLEINPNHEVFQTLQDAFEQDKEKLSLYTNLRVQSGAPHRRPADSGPCGIYETIFARSWCKQKKESSHKETIPFFIMYAHSALGFGCFLLFKPFFQACFNFLQAFPFGFRYHVETRRK